MHVHRGGPRAILAVVGGESLLGREIRDALESSGLAVNVKLIAADAAEDTRIIAAVGDEPVVINSIELADLGSAQFVMLSGSKESSRKAYEQLQNLNASAVVIDLNGGLEDHPGSRLRAPLLDPKASDSAGAIQVIAHPAAIALALLLRHLRTAGAIRRAVVEIFEPVSERGREGIDELQKQMVALLSFKPLPKDIFDTQVAFNLITEYGSDSPHKLAEIELKIDRHLASLLASMGNVPMPSLRVIQAPVFHGYSASLWLEFEESTELDTIIDALKADNIDLRTGDQEPPTNVGVAGQSGITVGAITPDRNQPRAFWFWMTADNLRITAENAVGVVRETLK
jgi:aspartate-semialdehyde dehydrogenase